MTLTDLVTAGDTVEEGVGGRFGAGLGAIVDLVNPLGIVEDLSFAAEYFDLVAEILARQVREPFVDKKIPTKKEED